MKPDPKPITEADFIALITRGAARLTPDDVHRLVADLPDLRVRFRTLSEAGHPEAEHALNFLAEIVEKVWTDLYREMPYGAALEAAFAIAYFAREGDLIPDTLGAIGLVDDIAVAQTILLRNATTFRAFAYQTKTPWPTEGATPSS